MAKSQGRIPIPGRLRDAIFNGFNRAYIHVKVDPDEYLRRVQRAHGLPIQSFRDMFFVPQETLDNLADQTISPSMELAVLDGAGLGIGRFLPVVPDMGLLSAIVVRLLQKLSLLYGFEYSTDEELVTFWLAAASAAGMDLGREFIEKQAVERVVPRIMERVAVKMGAEVAERWSARLIPLLSSAIGGGLNYYFVREWGRRAKQHFREKHRALRAQMAFAGSQQLTAQIPHPEQNN